MFSIYFSLQSFVLKSKNKYAYGFDRQIIFSSLGDSVSPDYIFESREILYTMQLIVSNNIIITVYLLLFLLLSLNKNVAYFSLWRSLNWIHRTIICYTHNTLLHTRFGGDVNVVNGARSTQILLQSRKPREIPHWTAGFRNQRLQYSSWMSNVYGMIIIIYYVCGYNTPRIYRTIHDNIYLTDYKKFLNRFLKMFGNITSLYTAMFESV